MRPFIDPTMFIFESVFSAVIIVLCLLIYLKTKEMYDLTKHKGIGFFRSTFLIFGIAHLFRFIFAVSHLLVDPRTFPLIPFKFRPFLMIPVGFLATLALMFLLYSTIWKRYKRHTTLLIIIAYIVSIIPPILTLIYRSKEIIILFQAIIFIATISISLVSYIKTKKLSKLFYIYILIFAFWLINMVFIGKRPFYPIEIMMIVQLVSIGIFGTIYYKVNKWTK